MNRTKAREYAFIILFQYKFQPEDIGEILDDFCAEYKPGEQEDYIRGAVIGVTENIDEIDKTISKHSEKWGIDHMSVVNLSALRLSVGEMLYMKDIPPVVSVNEAVRIAKLYDGEESAPFINGVLDNIRNGL